MASLTYLIEADALGQCWLRVSGLILDQGQPSRYDGAATRELAHLSLMVEHPDPQDLLIGRYGDPAWLAWMHENFFVQKEVAELGQADSYAVRLFNYARQGRDQIQWVVDRLRGNPESCSAPITTFAPLTDTSYIPCISLLDFWIPDGQVELVVYAHSLDFGKKAYGNLVELALLQTHVAEQLGRPVGRLIIHVKSAHIYEPEWEMMQGICQAEAIIPETAYR
jgi:thymidylate synthase